jgi:hypothetical protein
MNCEQGVMWALTDRPVSAQLDRGLLLTLILVILAIA